MLQVDARRPLHLAIGRNRLPPGPGARPRGGRVPGASGHGERHAEDVADSARGRDQQERTDVARRTVHGMPRPTPRTWRASGDSANGRDLVHRGNRRGDGSSDGARVHPPAVLDGHQEKRSASSTPTHAHHPTPFTRRFGPCCRGYSGRTEPVGQLFSSAFAQSNASSR